MSCLNFRFYCPSLPHAGSTNEKTNKVTGYIKDQEAKKPFDVKKQVDLQLITGEKMEAAQLDRVQQEKLGLLHTQAENAQLSKC